MNDIKPNWSEKEHLFPGIWVYRDVIKKELNTFGLMDEAIKENRKVKVDYKFFESKLCSVEEFYKYLKI